MAMYDDEAVIDVTKLRYVLYARKSTDDPKRQLRSIPDQIDECKAMAERLSLNITATIREDRSAKKPNHRPKFTQLLKDLRAKKYDAILAWNPDRLARNMKEGGEVIDMVDEAIIKDLKFVTHTFTPDANGKMLLGMAFVLSKQYSDKLSQDVTRGVKRGLEQGKSAGTPKHGYVRENGFYRPDGNHFKLVCKAWLMRKEGQSLKAIAAYMNGHGYARTYKEGAQKAGQKVYMSDKILSDRVFNDPFYYGILTQKGKQIDLRELPGYNFIPATDEETYNAVQAMTGRRIVTEKKRTVFKPLVGMVRCAYCNRAMYPQTPLSGRKSEKTRILSYRCDTPFCPRKKKELNLPQSIRAKVIFNFMYGHLKGFRATRADYVQLRNRLATKNNAQLQSLTIKIHSKEGALKNVEREIKDRSLKIINLPPDGPVYKNNAAHVADLEVERQRLVDDIAKLKEQLTDPEQDILSYGEFLNVANNADLHLKAADVGAKDRIARLIYLNVVVDDQNVVDFQIREPFKTYFNMHQISTGRGDRT
jgi:DNA invertase Pin-like site-specific DNA recombinase